MFKRILIPVDGSDLDASAIRTGVELAAACQARVYAFHVVQSYHSLSYVTATLAASELIYMETAEGVAQQAIAVVRQAAGAAGVPCDGGFVTADHPYEAILQAAKQQQSDLIVMSSSGRRGMDRLLLGSETQKVLLNTDVPVLVCR